MIAAQFIYLINDYFSSPYRKKKRAFRLCVIVWLDCSVFDEDTVRGFIGVVTYAVADTQRSKSFFSLPGEKTGRKSHACRTVESMDRLLMTLIARAVPYRKFHDKLVRVCNVQIAKNSESSWKLWVTNRKLFRFIAKKFLLIFWWSIKFNALSTNNDW